MARRAIGAVLGAVAVLVATTGCTTSTVRDGAAPALQVVRVDPSLIHSAAESVARLHEGDFTLVGLGKSMLPVYAPGTVVVVHPTSYFMLRQGMAVVYTNRGGRRVAHVLTEESNLGWRTRGLNNAEDDDELVTSGNLVGMIRCAFVPESAASVASNTVAVLDSSAASRIALLH